MAMFGGEVACSYLRGHKSPVVAPLAKKSDSATPYCLSSARSPKRLSDSSILAPLQRTVMRMPEGTRTPCPRRQALEELQQS